MSPSQITVVLFGLSLTILIAWYFWFAHRHLPLVTPNVTSAGSPLLKDE